MCQGQKIVLMIDEVDKASNNRVFIHFLGMLRDKFLARNKGKDYTALRHALSQTSAA
jgi:hypothetical protein